LAKRLVETRGVFCVHKVTRSGCTISLVKSCCELGKKVVVIFPTRRIAKEIKTRTPQVLRRRPKMAIIGPNTELCKKLDTDLDLKFQFKKNCGNCEFRDRPQKCVFQDLLVNEFDIYCLTYDKLQALLKSMSKETMMLLGKLRNCDVFVFDEFATAVIRDIPTLSVVAINENGKPAKLSVYLRSSFNDELRQFDKILREASYESSDKMKVESDLWMTIELFLGQFENINQSGVYKNKAIEAFSKDDLKRLFIYGWKRITELTKEGKNTSVLQEIFLISMAREITLTCEDGTVKVTPRIEDALSYIRAFCNSLGDEKLLFAVDSYQPSVDFDNVFGKPVRHLLWGENGDPLDSDRQQLILSDTAHWSSVDFCRDSSLQRRAHFLIEDLLELFSPRQIIIVTTNKKTAKTISTWNLPKEVKLTWHRSDWMRGVTVEDRRVMICVGGPYLPKTAYVSEAHSFDFKDFTQKLENLHAEQRVTQISKILRADDTKSEFINAIGRVKDPTSVERSLVITLGMNFRDVQAMLKQNTGPFVSRPHLIRPFKKGGLHHDGLWIAKLWFDKANVEIGDLSVLARIIRYVKEKKSVSASQIIPRQTELVIEKAVRYKEILELYGVITVSKQGGVSLEQT